jgi:hypothetical protein
MEIHLSTLPLIHKIVNRESVTVNQEQVTSNHQQLLIRSSFSFILLILLSGGQLSAKKEIIKADVVIYGGTPAAVTAAVQSMRDGHSAVIVCPEKHLGGMSSSGLGFTDTGKKEIIGGLAREFYQRIYQYYQKPETWKWQTPESYGNRGQNTPAIDGGAKTMWIFEPHVAEAVFEDMVLENRIPVYRDQWLNRENGVRMTGHKILSITMLSGMVFKGSVFIDATYEGDLMAAAGIPYAVGREPANQYGEQWNGIQTGILPHGHHFGSLNISPYRIPGNPESGVLPRISTSGPGKKGDGDHRVQAYCYRMCLTREPKNRIPIERPPGYDSTQYDLMARILDAGWTQVFNKFDPIPNLKTDVNNHGPFSFDNIGMNYRYPEASYEERAAIIAEHRTYQQGWLYFMSNDPRVPESIRSAMSEWGLAADEFLDNNHWPWQLYIREARRMTGTEIMTENEIHGRSPVATSIGMGSYTMDSHNVQRYITPEGYVQNEGDIEVAVKRPYQISMGSILPIRDDCTNLLVPVALSATHIAYGSIRMEPVFMILGQSAAILAHLSMQEKSVLQDLPYLLVRDKLLRAGQILEKP